MISETGRQIRVTIPVPVFERIERTAAALGTTVNELGTRCVVEGIGPAIVARIGELEQSLAALKTEIAPVAKPAIKPAKTVPTPLVRQGRAEKAAAVRAAELAEERLRGNRRKRSNGKEAAA